MSRRVAALQVALGWALCVTAPARAEEALASPQAGATLFTLKNGLRVVLDPVPGHPSVAVVVAYDAGWSRDPPGYSGLAHLVEHLTFRGSRHLPGQGIIERLEAAGSTNWNGTTTPDLAIYHAVVPAEHLALPLWIESERMAFTLEAFTQGNLELEQQRVNKELLQRGRVDPTFGLFINQALYPEGHPYRATRDELDEVLAAELSDVSWFFQAHYRPDNAYLVMTGGVHARAASLVRRYFEPIANPPGPPPPRRAVVRAFTARETLTVKQPVYVDNQLVMIFAAPAIASGDGPAFDLLEGLLEGASRWSLDRALVGGELAEWAEIDLEHRALGSVTLVRALLRPGVSMERAERAVEKLFARLGHFDDAPALNETNSALSVSMVSDLDDPLALAFRHLNELRGRGRPYDLATDLKRRRSVRAEDVASVARRFLDPKRRLSARLLNGSYACRSGCVSLEVEGQ